VQGHGEDAGPAVSVVDEITSAGGTAIADTNDVSAPDGASALVAAALGRFGRIDIHVNNAGIMRWAGMPDVDLANLDAHLAVHVAGSFNTARAAWPHMVEQAYGRIVMTTSSGVFGLRDNTSYAAAKGAVIGLTRSLAVAGKKHRITVNAIAPAAATRMAGLATDDDESRARRPEFAHMSPDLVAPMVAFLAHEDCPVSGEIYAAGAGRFARIFIASTAGYTNPDATVEDVAANWAAINDETEYTVPPDLMAWSARFLDHLSTMPPTD
jgi:NAD(P)-dependent dehydrogenase (short-subunit alcohol dehydrogenase family)